MFLLLDINDDTSAHTRLSQDVSRKIVVWLQPMSGAVKTVKIPIIGELRMYMFRIMHSQFSLYVDVFLYSE